MSLRYSDQHSRLHMPIHTHTYAGDTHAQAGTDRRLQERKRSDAGAHEVQGQARQERARKREKMRLKARVCVKD